MSKRLLVTTSCYRSLNALTEVEEPAEMGDSLRKDAHRHRSILAPHLGHGCFDEYCPIGPSL